MTLRLETKNAPDDGTGLDDLKAAIEQHAETTAATIAKQADEIKGLKASLLELEQKGADDGRTTAHRGNARTSLAKTLVENAEFKAVAEKKTTRTSIEVKASDLLEQKNTITYDSDYFDVTDRQPGIVTDPRRRTWLRERFPSVPTNGGSVEYHRLLTFTNNSAPQGGGSPHEFEGVAKAESAMTFQAVERKVQTIAHFIKASKQILGDVPALGMTLDTQLKYGLELTIESQIITGNGNNSNFSGLTASGNYTAFTPTSGDTALDSLSRALAAIAAGDGVADLIVLHPNDWASIQRLKADTAGTFLLGNPAAGNAPNVWGVPVHVTPAMTEGKFIAMSTMAAVVWTRSDAAVTIGWVSDDFTKNLVTILAEARLCLGVQIPALVRYGDLTV